VAHVAQKKFWPIVIRLTKQWSVGAPVFYGHIYSLQMQSSWLFHFIIFREIIHTKQQVWLDRPIKKRGKTTFFFFNILSNHLFVCKKKEKSHALPDLALSLVKFFIILIQLCLQCIKCISFFQIFWWEFDISQNNWKMQHMSMHAEKNNLCASCVISNSARE
jgi:hypothetical protein